MAFRIVGSVMCASYLWVAFTLDGEPAMFSMTYKMFKKESWQSLGDTSMLRVCNQMVIFLQFFTSMRGSS
ncbi:hypothetical protein AMECASPLE_021016 [Ameca splendens]|uniref:Secreted protein n=1 Tax=Ameca splendens TaxID=208324 RepID=A0ABV0YQR4_9TELE